MSDVGSPKHAGRLALAWLLWVVLGWAAQLERCLAAGWPAGAADSPAVISHVAPMQATNTWSVETGFSTTANPSGPWSYGYMTRAGTAPDPATFSRFDKFVAASPCPLWCSSALYPVSGVDPNVTYNNTASPQWCCAGARIDWDPGEMSIGPGLNGELTVVRWTAPFNGHYDIAARFLDNQETGDSADAYVYHNTTRLFAGYPGTSVGFGVDYSRTSLWLAAGDTLDFMIGPGSDQIATGNHTTLTATINHNATNHPPMAGLHIAGTEVNTPVALLISKLIARDSDPEGDPLGITAASSASTNGGSVALGSTDITYAPPANYVGTDALTYTLSDGPGATATATVVVIIGNGLSANITSWSHDALNHAMTVNFAGIPGLTYRIQYAESLAQPIVWTDIATNAAPPNGLFSATNSAALTTNGVYRATCL